MPGRPPAMPLETDMHLPNGDLTLILSLVIRQFDIHRPPRSALAWIGLVLAAVVISSLLGLPLLHEALHEAGSSESECPVHLLQSGIALVLVVCGALLALPDLARSSIPGGYCVVILGDPRRQPRAPRAPPYHSSDLKSI